jgi:hypothetical protein
LPFGDSIECGIPFAGFFQSMRTFFLFLPILVAAGCSSDSGGGVPVASCSIDGQKQFVVDAMRDWYFWNDRLPANVDITQFGTPDDVLQHLASFSPDDGNGRPVDRFSFINSAQSDQEFFGEGRFGGFGFSSRFVADDNVRLSRVFTDSPAWRAGLRRGQRILELDGRTIAEIQAAEGINAVLATESLTFAMRDVSGDEFSVSITRGSVTIDPVPQFRIIDLAGGRNVGYIELATFVATADAELDAVFAQFLAAGVNDVILDLRYNGGGLVSTANLLGDLLGGQVAENLIFSKTVFNEQRAAENNSQEFFDRRGGSISLSRLVVIATGATASASEMVINGVGPHAEVAIVGADTLGKPVGQVGLQFCEQILRPTAFQTLNANDFGDYFDGLPATCVAPDDLDVSVGADEDPNMIAAMTWFDTGACPVSLARARKPAPGPARSVPYRGSSPARQFADAF